MTGFLEINPILNDPCHLRAPQVQVIDRVRDHAEVTEAINRLLGDPALRVNAVSPVQAVTTSADEYGNVIAQYFATVVYQEQLRIECRECGGKGSFKAGHLNPDKTPLPCDFCDGKGFLWPEQARELSGVAQ